MNTLADPPTPFAVVDRARAQKNARHLTQQLGAPLRLHVKTAKSLEVAALVFPDEPGPIAVSTLAEAEHFAAAGYTDIVYAVGIAPDKLPRVLALLQRGARLTVLLDSAAQARAVADASRHAGIPIGALIELDCDGHRSGLQPDDPTLVELARLIADGGEFRGLLAHAGESYHARSQDELRDAAINERDCILRAAEYLRTAGFPSPIVSIGSTPTALAPIDRTGITDVRAGNFVFFDLVMAGVGVCTPDDIALSVVVTVIGHQPAKGWIVTDGGWMATSRDHGPEHGYGLVTDLSGRLIPGLAMTQANQEHGILTTLPGSHGSTPQPAIGTRLRILPHHACATAAQHTHYQIIDSTRGSEHVPRIKDAWPRANGW